MVSRTLNNIKATLATIIAGTVLADTQASVRESPNVSAMAVKPKKGRAEHIAVTLTQAMLDGRMKLPARVFTKGNKVVIDGHTITQQEADQGRSTKFNPEIFGYDLSVGDLLIFSHEGGREWSVEAQEGTRTTKATAAKSKPAAKTAAKSSTKRTAKPSEDEDEADGWDNGTAKSKKSAKPTQATNKLARDGKVGESLNSGIKRFAKMALENASTKGFKKNENIMQTGAFEVDARVYFTTAQSQKFRSWRKKQGLTLRKAVGLLNSEVYE